MGSSLLTKAWNCPACSREFIVASDTTKDVCPWCNTPIEERNGQLEKTSQPTPSEAASTASAEQAAVDGASQAVELAQSGEEFAV